MALPVFTVESFTFNTPPSLDGKPPLKMAAKRYTNSCQSRDGVTVLLAHSIGTHKEHWEPMLHNLFEAQSNKSPSHRIREAWAFDWQTHGDSAVLNSNALKSRPDGVSITEWARALVAFVNSKHAVLRRLVVIGHAGGASTWMYSTKFFPFRIPYLTVILVEPKLIHLDAFDNSIQGQGDFDGWFPEATTTRRGSWSSKKDASRYLGGHFPWNAWDTRVLRIHVDQGLHTDPLNGDVVPKCDKVYEDASYLDYEAISDATDQIAKVYGNVHIHIIYGELNDSVPRYLQASPVNKSQGLKVASIVRVPGAGHMLPQEAPDALARCISNLLDNSFKDSILGYRL
ncbi:hypothetical protein PILCRDRAFT_813871 [Piloderma croceum F 1598]|uniref:AB hydrolase-1 domain-containing protein n=1 Tax=Piloderma croceum (strain F 1598) TaxID=765440 RepID=A0A0C3FX93_PILCF|nr:hypothetical protein PILCRDRAFT_813871 [Piloderma croceum F 1598]